MPQGLLNLMFLSTYHLFSCVVYSTAFLLLRQFIFIHCLSFIFICLFTGRFEV